MPVVPASMERISSGIRSPSNSACSGLAPVERGKDRSRVQAHLLVDKASLSKIRKLVRADLVKVGARPSVVFDCLVAVTEACTQALHGRGERVGEPSKITWTIDRSRAEFCVEDYSKQAEKP